MKMRLSRGMATLLFFCMVVCAFYLREATQPQYMQLPVSRVLSYVTDNKTFGAQDYRTQREEQRKTEIDALTALAQTGDKQAAEYLGALIERAESELAMENALAALGIDQAICAVRENAVMICMPQKADAALAQTLIELCCKITGECAENVFILDECRYS